MSNRGSTCWLVSAECFLSDSVKYLHLSRYRFCRPIKMVINLKTILLPHWVIKVSGSKMIISYAGWLFGGRRRWKNSIFSKCSISSNCTIITLLHTYNSLFISRLRPSKQVQTPVISFGGITRMIMVYYGPDWVNGNCSRASSPGNSNNCINHTVWVCFAQSHNSIYTPPLSWCFNSPLSSSRALPWDRQNTQIKPL